MEATSRWYGCSPRDFDSFAVNAVVAHPAVNMAPIVANLKSAAIYCFDEVQIIAPADPNQHNVIRVQIHWITRSHRYQVAVIDAAAHRMPARPNLDRLTLAQTLDREFGPTHPDLQYPRSPRPGPKIARFHEILVDAVVGADRDRVRVSEDKLPPGNVAVF